MLYQNLTHGFLCVSWNVESEITFVNFSYSVAIKPIDRSCKIYCRLNGCFTPVWILLTSCYGIWKILVYWDCRSSKCWYVSLNNITKSYLLSSTPILENSLNVGKLSVSQWQIQVFQISNFNPKAQILSSATNTASCFTWSNKLTLFVRNSLPNTQVWTTSFFDVILPNKNCVHWKKVASSACSSFAKCFPETLVIVGMP